MIDLSATYRALDRPWPADELAGHYRAARQRGVADLPVGQLAPSRPIVFLAAALPRLTALTVSAHLLHVLPPTSLDRTVFNELLDTVDQASAGALCRVHLALAAADNARVQDDDIDGWLPIICDETADLLRAATPDARPFPLIAYAEHTTQLAASAIEALDRDSPTSQETIADCLARLLAVNVIAQKAAGPSLESA